MNMFRQLHEWSEKNIWNTLTRKLMGFTLVFLINLVYVGIYLYVKASVLDTLSSSGANAEVARVVVSALDQGLVWMAILTGIAFVWIILQIAYVRYLVVSPVKNMARIFDEIASGQGDFSRDLPATTHDEFGDLAISYNRFADRIREIIGEIRKMSVSIARDAAIMRKSVGETSTRAARQGKLTEAVFTASNEATKAINEVSLSTELISRSTEVNLGNAKGSLQEMLEIVVKVQSVSKKLARFNDTVAHLSQRSDSIRTMAALIRDVADQTNLLALNAAIEAARAGEMGRGFAVVADEVRKLAERVNNSALEITQSVTGMIALVQDTQSENDMINVDIRQTREVVERSSEQFRQMVGDFEGTSGQLIQIAAAMEQLTATNAQVHENMRQVHSLSGEVAQRMGSSEKAAGELSNTTESVQELVSSFKIGRGTFDYNIDLVRKFRDELQRKLEDMRQRGVNVMDRNYRPIMTPKTKPQKFTVSYDEAYMRECQGLLDSALASIKGGVYAVGVDFNGYLVAHNAPFSQPLTGDQQKDLIGNRTHRMFDTPTELRAAKATAPLLLQTYLRDTGELMCDISMPIYVGGVHWGAVRVGCHTAALLEG
ncbi:Methyl-accepting chemotaxis sensory transducer [Candidatus Accumulibacter aalborgensis]|uniref:Methyl-accepting chemotaxis sensory transducer n=2 Tax=Candidatus Accumulibacter aalborgensis TaxID=1860102 RepID=A0A1A8XXV1_9PROT|nr:Methyl-accepting chemotaxis sensory transducer [Candidatus Accumulibacter aalborgensis]